MLTGEKQKDFESFALASPSVSQKGRFPRKNPKLYSQAPQAQHQTDSTYTSQAQSKRSQSQAPVQAQTQVGIQDQLTQLAQAQAQTELAFKISRLL